MIIRTLQPRDYVHLSTMDWSPMARPSPATFLYWVTDQPHVCLVACEDNTPFSGYYGVLLASRSSDGRSLYICKMKIIEEYQRKGIGRALIAGLKRIGESIKASRIWCLTCPPIDEFYKKCGFKENRALLPRRLWPFMIDDLVVLEWRPDGQ